ncbi:hypothetical protein GFY24_37190 [Nocardia sp. SYP-A9097]|uniref:hypothetical protein n=1 Tax=Nocardia sp. SYP-A9097 TaxID=2663237 RepID=UPI00129BF9B9|nr:hypothetical protein [Nocardia sp. SYP-A9097]MRH92992.1 hypothetical protein [Nocardia sp. SYP-A9097]
MSKRKHGGATRFAAATAAPIAAALLAVQPAVAGADPGLPDAIGEILSGSAGSGPAAPIEAPTGSSLGLGTGSSNSGNGGATSGSALGVNPVAGGGYLSTGSSATGSAGTGSADPAAAGIALLPGGAIGDAFGGAALRPAAGTLGETLGLEPGSVLTACAGSAIIGSAAIGLGLVTGSGFGSGLIGPGFIPGSSGLIGPGSAGAGSVILGSAVTGSALLTCLLLLPVPETPGIPLLFPSIPALAPVAAPIPPPEEQAPVLSPPPPPVVKPQHQIPTAAAPPAEPVDWNTLKMMTVIILTILAAARAKIGRSRRG